MPSLKKIRGYGLFSKFNLRANFSFIFIFEIIIILIKW